VLATCGACTLHHRSARSRVHDVAIGIACSRAWSASSSGPESSWLAAGLALALTWTGAHGCDDDDHDDGDGSWSDEDGGAGPIAIEHVTVLPMTGDDEEVVDPTVLIAGGRIEAIGPAGEVELPSGVLRVDGSEKWLMPALADSHVHVENERLMRFLVADPDLPDGSVDDRGTVEPGKRADLLLLDGDPRQNIAATREIAAVIVRGRLLGRDDLDRMLEDLSARAAAR
jgi:hypothetical protein